MLYREIIAVCSHIHTKHINTLCGQNVELLGAFVKLRKPTISFVMAVRLSVRPHTTTRLALDGFSLNLIPPYFSNICRANSSFIKI
jgi:hypothetical protein